MVHPTDLGRSGNVVSPTIRLHTSVYGQGSRKVTCWVRGYGILEKAKGYL